MWTVKTKLKRIADGALLEVRNEVVFETRSLADSYICADATEAAKVGNYVTADLSHPRYGHFHSDPSYWDLINMRKAYQNEAILR